MSVPTTILQPTTSTPSQGTVAVDSYPAGQGNNEASAAQSTGNYYLDGRFDSEYNWDFGLRLMDVAGPPGTPPEVIRVHSGHCFRVVRWTSLRVGATPDNPAPKTNANEILFRAIVCPLTPIPWPGGSRVYRTSGVYYYLLLTSPVIGTDRLSAGTAPWDGYTSSQNDVLPGSFNPALLDASSAVPGGGNPNIKDLLGS